MTLESGNRQDLDSDNSNELKSPQSSDNAGGRDNMASPDGSSRGSEGRGRSRSQILRWIAAVISAVAGICGIVGFLTSWRVPGCGIPAGPTGSSSLVAPDPLRCISMDYLSPNLFPHYLLPSMGGSENFPYWFKIVGANECDTKLFLTVRFERGANINLEPQLEPLTLDPASTFERVYTPEFSLGSLDIRRIKIFWSIEDDVQRKFHEGSIETQIVPPNTIAWDLEKPKAPAETEPVDKEYILASLSAWTKKPPRRVHDFVSEYRRPQISGPMLIKEAAIEACYNHLFRKNKAVHVITSAIRFPDGSRQEIKPVSEVIERGSASCLEAALLLAASLGIEHRSGIDPDIVMIVGPEDGNGLSKVSKTTFIAWRESGKEWRGIDMMFAGLRDFGVNASLASARLASILQENPDIEPSLEKNGAYCDDDFTIAAVNFRKAGEIYGIEPIPKVVPRTQ